MKKLLPLICFIVLAWASPVFAWYGPMTYASVHTGTCNDSPCTDCTTDGDGSTSLVLCEQFISDGGTDTTCNLGGETNLTYETGSTPTVATSYALQTGGSNSPAYKSFAATTEYTTSILFKAPDDSNYSLLAATKDLVSGREAWQIRITTNTNLSFYHNADDDAVKTDNFTIVPGTYYLAEVYYKSDQSSDGIQLYLYEFGTTRIEKTIADDSTWDVTDSPTGTGVNYVYWYDDSDADADATRIRFYYTKIRNGSDFPPIPCTSSGATAALVPTLKSGVVKVGGATGMCATDPADYIAVAEFDLALLRKLNWDDCNVGSDYTFDLMKGLNPSMKIFVYTQAHECANYQDAYHVQSTNSLARWDVDRGHSMGDINTDNRALILQDSSSSTDVYIAANHFILDPGLANTKLYSVEAVEDDWDAGAAKWDSADGFYSDNLHLVLTQTGMSDTSPDNYDAGSAADQQALWQTAMVGFIDAITVEMHSEGKEFAINCGGTHSSAGYGPAAYAELNATSNPPDFTLEEGFLVVDYGGGDAQFFPETRAMYTIDAVAAVTNFTVFALAHCELTNMSDEGYDNFCTAEVKSVANCKISDPDSIFTGYDALYYSLAGAFMAVRYDTGVPLLYFGFIHNKHEVEYSSQTWHAEFDMAIGEPVAAYTTVDCTTGDGSPDIYFREFDDGYVAFNPTDTDATGCALPATCKAITSDNFRTDMNYTGEADVNSFSLDRRRGKFFYKNSSLP